MTAHVYDNTFFDYIDRGARSSAQPFVACLQAWLAPSSVLDLGCGRGVWLKEWRRAGVDDVLGVDGDYVDRSNLLVPEEQFRAGDLTGALELERRFDLAQSLEVGEHLPESASDALVNSLTASSDIVLFSAAVVGQGGEFHINEQPLSYWQKKFEARGYHAYDCLRPLLRCDSTIEPWYRYNAVLYVNAAGEAKLPEAVRSRKLPKGEFLRNDGNLRWRLRRGIVSLLPRAAVTRIAQLRAAVLASWPRRNSIG